MIPGGLNLMMMKTSSPGAGGITFVGSSSGYNHVDFSLSLPEGLQEDDVVILVQKNSRGVRPIHPSGWTNIYSNTGTEATRISYKVMGSTPDESVSIDPAVTTYPTLAYARAYRGVNTSTVQDASIVVNTAGSGDPSCSEITTVTDGALVLAVGVMDDDEVTEVSVYPSGYSNTEFAASSGYPTDEVSIMACDKVVATAGAETPGGFTTNRDNANAGYTLALRPA